MINYEALPAIYRGRLQLYVTRGTDPGPYLQALLAGDLFTAIKHAGDFDLTCLGQVVFWICSEPLPELCWGDRIRVDGWLRFNQQREAAAVARPRPDAGVPDPQLAVEPAVEPPAGEAAPEMLKPARR